MRYLSSILAASVLVLLSSCSKAPTVPFLAKVGDHLITAADFEAEIAYRQKVQQPLPEKHALLEEMIAREVALQKARAAGLENDPEVRRSYEDMLTVKLREKKLTPKVNALAISTDEAEAAYHAEITRHTRPAKAKLALIYVKTERTTSAKKKAELAARMTEAHEQAKALPSLAQGFGVLAATYSEDQASRFRGGDVGWYDEGEALYRWPKEVISAGLTLKNNGDLSDVIQTTNGFYLVTRMDSRAAVITPFDQVKSGIQNRMLSARKQQAESNYARELRSSFPVQTDSSALEKVAYPTQSMARSSEPLPPGMPAAQ